MVLSLSPMPLSEDRDLEYSVPHNENFTVTCTAMSHDPNVFVLWRRTDGKQNKRYLFALLQNLLKFNIMTTQNLRRENIFTNC